MPPRIPGISLSRLAAASPRTNAPAASSMGRTELPQDLPRVGGSCPCTERGGGSLGTRAQLSEKTGSSPMSEPWRPPHALTPCWVLFHSCSRLAGQLDPHLPAHPTGPHSQPLKSSLRPGARCAAWGILAGGLSKAQHRRSVTIGSTPDSLSCFSGAEQRVRMKPLPQG